MASGMQAVQGELYCPTCEQTFARGERCPTDNTRLVRIATTTDKLLGRELDGRYTIVEKIGQGGMGAVYRGTQHSVGREVAIKVVTPSLVADTLTIKRFLREAKLASKLSHPNAVSVLDFGQTEDGLFFLIMELVVGRTLDKVLEGERTLPPARVVRIGAQICDALEGAHELQIVHRDLKPQNVMVLSKGRDHVKVLDFGLAKSLTPDPGSATMTNAGALLGTPAFMPPELVTNQDVDARADLYSLGCVLYVCASGRLPFTASSVHELIAMHASEPPPPIAGIPARGLGGVIMRLLEKDPARRFQTAAQTRDALEAVLAGDAAPVQEIDESAMKSGPATLIGWTSNTGGPSRAVRIATPPSGVPKLARAATPAGGIARVATPASGVARVATPASGVARVATPASGVARVATPASGVARVPVSSVAPVAADEADLVSRQPTLLDPGMLAHSHGPPAIPAPAAVTAHVRTSHAASRLPLILGAIAVVIVSAIVAYVVVARGKDSPAHAPAVNEPTPAVTPTPPVTPPPPANIAPPVETPPAPPGPVTEPAAPPTTKPVPPPVKPAVRPKPTPKPDPVPQHDPRPTHAPVRINPGVE